MSAEYHFSTLSVVGTGRNKLEQLSGTRIPLAWIGSQAEEMGYQGVAVIPTIRIYSDIVEGALTKTETQQAKSGGQIFRTEKTIAQSLRHPNPVLATQALLTFPHKDVSLHALTALQHQKGDDPFPVVVQTVDDVRYGQRIGLKQMAVILSPENMRDVGARDGLHFEEMAAYDGIDICLDPTYQLVRHYVNGSPSPFNNPNDTILQVWQHTSIVNLSLGRTDLGNTNSPGQLQDLYSGSNYTNIRQILMVMRAAIEKTNHVPPIVMQIPYTGVGEVLGKRSVTCNDLSKVHNPVLAEVKRLLEGR